MRDKYLDELGLCEKIYKGNFVKGKKWLRFQERRQYGFDYRDVMNMKISFAEWLYSHMKHFEKWNVRDLDMHTVEFQGKIYTVAEAIKIIIEISGDYLKLFETEECGGNYSDEEKDAADKTMKFATNLFAEIAPYLWC